MPERRARSVDRVRRLAVSWAGPTLIVGSVLLVLHDFAFRGLAPSQRGDVLSFWLPNHCFLGTNLAGGHLPAWNPHVMGGVPFAADPQSGWLYLPAMLLYAVLPCGSALAWFIVLQPLLAGLAIWWFLRTEGLSRTAATIGGLVLAMAMASSTIAISLPVAGSLAWSALLLALAAQYARAETWSARLPWATAAALAWGQLATAHLSHGLIMGTGAVLLYLGGRTLSDIRGGRRSVRETVAIWGLFLALLVPLNLGSLAPRLSYLSRSNLGLGYEGLQEAGNRPGGIELRALNPKATGGLAWPLRFGTSPGAYLGATALGLSIVALGWRRHRDMAGSMAAFGIISYVLPLPGLARALAPAVRHLPFGDVYLHAPARFRYGLLLVVPVLAAVGADAWKERGPLGRRLWLLTVAAALWGLLPLLLGVDPSYLALLAGGAAVGGVALVGARRRPALVSLLPPLLAVELSVGALAGQAADRELETGPPGREPLWDTPFGNLQQPDIDLASYLSAGPIGEALRAGDGRYLSIRQEDSAAGYAGRWSEHDAGLIDSQRAIVLGLEDAQGYNPVQSRRYWLFARRVNPRLRKYNITVFPDPSAAVLDLLQITSIVGPPALQPGRGFTRDLRHGAWILYRGPAGSRASLAFSWSVGSTTTALETAVSPGFDPARHAMLEQDPRLEQGSPSRGSGWARYRPLGTDRSRVDLYAPAPAVLVVRNVYDVHWQATVDGRPVDVIPTDYLVQGVPVPAGRHVVDLRYEDPAINVGLLGSILTLALLAVAATAAKLVERSRRSGDG